MTSYLLRSLTSQKASETRIQRGNAALALLPLCVSLLLSQAAQGETPQACIQQAAEADRTTIAAKPEHVHWGYLSRSLPPVVTVQSGQIVTIETLTHHAGDDHARMIEGDPGAESVYAWSETTKGVDRRGAGPVDGSLYGRGAGEGLGVHILTGPVYVCGARPGDVLEVQIMDVRPRPSGNPAFDGFSYGSNVAAAWGFHYEDLIETPRPREVVTIYEVESTGRRDWARAVYRYRWTPQTDPFGVTHETIDYPGVIVDHATTERNFATLEGIRVPLRMHFGFLGLAPAEAEVVDSVPPSYNGGNIDDWRAGAGSSLYLPVAVDGALFSVGDPHAAQGDSELSGTAIEMSLTGTFKFVLHRGDTQQGTILEGLSYPLLETDEAWVVHGFSYPNYLRDLGADAQQAIFAKSSLDAAMRDAFRKLRHFLMTVHGLSEDEAISLLSVAADFGVTQVVDGNWGVQATLRKSMFPARAEPVVSGDPAAH
ncbi:MAG: acetamidase/formamidase family protein, partial [Chromatocurvus sp.]